MSVRELEAKTAVSDALVALGADAQGGFVERGDRYIVHRSDLQKMIAMGLSEMPVESVAVLETSPILHLKNLELRETLEISNKLTHYFPGHMVAALYELQSLVKKGGFPAYVIGGNVRDILLYQERLLEIADVDITIEGDAISSSQFIVANSKNFVVEECYPEFGTVKIKYKDSIEFDFASTRKEVYRSCSALPDVVERGVPLSEDIIRRDFSVNALAMAVHELGNIQDFTNGIHDVENRLIRVLHPLSFFEDPSRILRALKFLARLDFELTNATRRLMSQFLKHGASVYNGGGERIKDELREFLSVEESPVKHKWVMFFLETGCLRLTNMHIPAEETFPEVRGVLERLSLTWPVIEEVFDGLEALDDALWRLYLCFLLGHLEEELFGETVHRLGLTRLEREHVEKFRTLRNSEALDNISDDSSPVDIYETFRDVPPVSAIAAALERFGDQPERYRMFLHALKTYLNKYIDLKPELNGKDLMELGVPEGEEVGQLLRELLHVKLRGRLADRMAEIRYIQHKLNPDQLDMPPENLEPEDSEVAHDASG